MTLSVPCTKVFSVLAVAFTSGKSFQISERSCPVLQLAPLHEIIVSRSGVLDHLLLFVGQLWKCDYAYLP